MKVNINFFEYMSVLKAFSKLYKLSENEIIRYAVEIIVDDNPTAEFIKKAGIKLDLIDVENVTLHCKHITTITDNFVSLNQYGLVTLDKALTLPTPLNKYLLEHDIKVDVVNRHIYYKGRKIHIVDSEEECESCFYGTECRELVNIFKEKTTLSYRNMSCDYRDEIKIIRSKLYHDKCEVEVHLVGSFEDVHGYSDVRHNPEILMTIENLIYKLFKEPTHLQRDWKNEVMGKYYCLEFDISILAFEYITQGKKYDYSEYREYFEFNSEEVFNLTDCNTNFFANVFILQIGIEVLRHEVPTIYGQILPETRVQFNDLTITEFCE